jgi:oligopeptide/dipeptide ABC transporter ATP-binding protein
VTDEKVEATGAGAPVVLEVKEMVTRFYTEAGAVTAVDGVSLVLRRGETLGIVGESGSGKSATAMSIMGLIDPPGFVEGGTVLLGGVDLRRLSQEQMRRVRGSRVSLVFQNPLTALNPALRIGWQLRESILSHRRMKPHDATEKIRRALQEVGISNPEKRERAYPHEYSGGMRQRTVIAMGIMNEPGVLIADEPTTALDVTIQAQVLELLKTLSRDHGLALLLITHNMGVVANMCDRVAVMYAGEIVEEGAVLDVFRNPRHPYTRALLHSMPHLGRKEKRLPSIPGTPPNMADMPTGCRFRDRCAFAEEICSQHPDLLEVDTDHKTRCWVGQRGQVFAEAPSVEATREAS